MKKIIIPALAMFLFSCQKENSNLSTPHLLRKLEVCTVDTNLISNNLIMAGRSKKWQITPTVPTSTPDPTPIPTPDPTPIPTPDPTPTPTPIPTGTYSCIYLDFDGEIVNSPYWNNGATIECASSGLSIQNIATVLATVQANFAAYNVVVTDQLSVYNAANPSMRQRVIITPTSYWKPNVGGISFINSISFGDGTPSFVFSDRMYYDSYYVGETATHESGHASGLLHQSVWTSSCTLSNAYAPNVIMGNSLLGTTGYWTTGTSSAGCNSYQDDRAILGANLGLK
ncbi:MAG: hypothetical protein ABIY51_11600 [Ferruginibacter sp.]